MSRRVTATVLSALVLSASLDLLTLPKCGTIRPSGGSCDAAWHVSSYIARVAPLRADS
jgi:hypothetical protein